MSVNTYIVGSSNKISISHAYTDSREYEQKMSDNIVEIDISRGVDDPAQFSNYTSISFGSNINRIASRCCYKFNQLQSVSFGAKTTTIGPYAFFACSQLDDVEFPNSLVSIGENAFQDCTQLKDVQFPNHTIIIGSYAFKNSGIESIDVQVDNQLGINVFEGCKSLKSAKVVGALVSNMFNGCTSLESVETAGDGITTIPPNCFCNCTSLTSVSFSNIAAITSIQANAFMNCTSLTSLKLQDMALTSIGANAFSGMMMTSIDLPATITSPTQLDPGFLNGTSVKSLKFLGMTYDAMWQERTSFSAFGSTIGLDMEIIASNGKKYGLDDTGLKKLDITAVVLIIAMGYNSNNASGWRPSLLKDIDLFKNEIHKAYKDNMNLILAEYVLSDPSYKGSNAPANKDNINKYFDKAAETEADLLLFLFSDHGDDKNICIYQDDNSGLSHYSYEALYNQFKRFKYVFAQLDCCYPNSAMDSTIDNFKKSGKKALIWTGGPKTQVTFANDKGHDLATTINKYFNALYTWEQQFNAIKNVRMGGRDGDSYITVMAHKYNYNNFPESSPVFKIVL